MIIIVLIIAGLWIAVSFVGLCFQYISFKIDSDGLYELGNNITKWTGLNYLSSDS